MSQRTDLTAQLRKIPAAAALPVDALNTLAQTVYTELEYRVGAALSAGLTDTQLREFENLINYEIAHPELGPDGPATAWLTTHRPGYPATVRNTLNQLLAETATALTQQNHQPAKQKH
jgi:hypothetical protein